METESESATICCARFYEQDWVQAVLGDSFHPGGVQLSTRLIASMSLSPGSRVLDVACGVGTTTNLMARHFGLDPVGLDVSEANLVKARDRSVHSPAVLVEFLNGSAESLPFPDESFDAVLCECAVSTFADQPRAVAEFFRILKPGGVIGISDMILEGPLPSDVVGLLSPWTCLAGARSIIGLQSLFLQAGLHVLSCTDETGSLHELIVELKRKLLTAGLVRSLSTLPGWENLDLKAMRDLLHRATEWIRAGTVQYSRLCFAKGRPRFASKSATVRNVQVPPSCEPSTSCCDAEARCG